jgi:superfamily I DNA and RNA helicase
MKEIFISATDTDDNLSSVNSAISSLIDDSLKSGAGLLVFDNGTNREVLKVLMESLKSEKRVQATIFSNNPSMEGFEHLSFYQSTIKDISAIKLPAQFIIISGSDSYLMRRGKEWHGYQNQPESTRLAIETLSRIRRLFF